MHEVVAWLGLGSNEGDREGQLRRAVAALAATPGIRVLQVSRFRESAPLGDGPAQGPFLNGACKIATLLPPHALLAVAKAIEHGAGRVLPAPRHHPRPLDVDILLWGDQRIDARDLIVPHPRLFEREFVQAPLRELGIDPAAVPRWPRPQVVRSATAFAALCSEWQHGGCRTGLVPTMGALHEGHASLLRRAVAECDRVAATVFVNPLQFGPHEDFTAYPRQFEQDLRVCAAAGVAAVFAPPVEEMYPAGFCSQIAVGREAEGMEGALRPGHFAGVATVVARLLATSRPCRAYFGQKDAQQCAVIRRLTADLGFPVEIVECPTVREPDGLAMSSRNVYLGAADRKASTVLFGALRAAAAAFQTGERDRDRLLAVARARIAAEPRAHLDYLELRSEPGLEPLPPGACTAGRLLVAARFLDGARPVRLLDNIALGQADAASVP